MKYRVGDRIRFTERYEGAMKFFTIGKIYKIKKVCGRYPSLIDETGNLHPWSEKSLKEQSKLIRTPLCKILYKGKK